MAADHLPGIRRPIYAAMSVCCSAAGDVASCSQSLMGSLPSNFITFCLPSFVSRLGSLLLPLSLIMRAPSHLMYMYRYASTLLGPLTVCALRFFLIAVSFLLLCLAFL